MQLLECIVTKPKLLENIKLNFDKRISVIYGKNESGKTLIAKGLMDTLWGEFSGSFSLNSNTWDDLYFEIVFKNYFSRYRFIKNKKDSFLINYADIKESGYNNEKVIVQRTIESGNNFSDGALCIKLFEATNDGETARLFNKVNIHTFMNTSYLPDPVDIVRNGRLDFNIIHRFLLNDSSNFYTLYENISESFSNGLISGGNNNPISNEILKVKSELKKLERKTQIAGIHNAKSDRLSKEKTRLEAELENLNSELSYARGYKAKLLIIQNNLKKLDQIKITVEEKTKKKQSEQEKINAIIKMEQEIKEHYPQFYNFEESNIKNLKRIQEAYREVRDVHEEIENFYLLISEKKNRYKNIILFINILSILVIAALFGVSSYAYPLPIINEYKIQFIIGLLILSISSSLFFLIYYIVISRTSGIKRIMKKKSDVEQKLAETLQKNSITLNEYKLETIYEYLVKYFEEYGEYSINQSEISTMRENFNGNDYINTIDNELEQLKRDENAAEQEINNELKLLGDNNVIELNDAIELNIEKINKLLQNKKQKIKNLKDNINQTANIITQINEEINHGIVHADETAYLNGEKNNILNTLARLNSYKISIEYIINLLKDAINMREDKQLSELVKTTGEYFHFLTGNQYLDSINGDYIKKIIKGEVRDEDLNSSLLHVLLLSIKFAITNSFADLEINLPLIIDNPFQHMDDQRISRLKDLMNEIADKRQIIIFTHDSKHKDLGAFIEL